MSFPDHLLIDGALVPGEGAEFSMTNPADGETIATLRSSLEGQLERATTAARKAQPSWNALSQGERSRALHAVAGRIRVEGERIAEALTYETGRPLTRNRLYVDMAVDIFRMYAELSRALGGRVAPSNDPGQLSMVLRAPYGVVGCLIPWNYPLLLLVFKVAPALATGNTVVIKPASETPLSLMVLSEIFAVTLPPGVVNTVLGSGRTVGEGLVTDPSVDMIAFTGSTEVGRRLGVLCAEATKPSHLELGGKDPAVVFGDADPAVAAEAVAWASFLNAGQVCTSTERVYVHESIHQRFVDEVVKVTESIRVGDPFDEATQVGPMRSYGRRRKVVGEIEAAVAGGATVAVGGSPIDRPGFFMEPTVLDDVDQSMGVMTDETFGPVLPIMSFSTDDEAFALAADTPYGLGASVYTENPSRVERAYRELNVGTVWVNDPVVDNLAAPFGGNRASGDARELGVEALDSFTTARHVHWNLSLESKPWWFRTE
ncbi:MAG: aldehyde dehydrogenase family protein [Acidimicrobiia bacterium]|nr:aldehyde dehydrogenase family protein [Acidimicrobiia bacterium]MDH3462467.1 aldehyde dehydrogenase family protein [Acidimicrobiia bacterium]